MNCNDSGLADILQKHNLGGGVRLPPSNPFALLLPELDSLEVGNRVVFNIRPLSSLLM